MPSIPELVYAALLYKDGETPENPPSTNFVQGTKATNSENLIFSFQKPRDTSGTFTLEIFAFTADTSAADFSRETALLSGSKIGCEIKNDAINVTDPIALSVNSASEVKGSVSLKIKVPTGCLLSISEIDENGVTVAENERHFTVTGTSPEFIVTQAGDGISAGAYQVTFTVKKGEEIVSIFSEYINVFPGMCTDTWDGSEKGAAKEITQSMISSTVYVRGEGGWYSSSDYNTTATANDNNSGSFLSPLATIQKAIDKIIAINDGTSEYTIFVDGTLTATSSAALADFNGVSQSLSVKIAGLSASNKAILNGNDTARCVTVGTVGEKKLNLTLENLVITNGNTTGRGGGIFFNGKTLEMTGCEVIGCEATDGGGGYIYSGSIFKMKGGTISNCIATSYGGGVYIDSSGTFEMSGTAKITGCKTTSTSSSSGGGGIYNAGTLTITGGTISDCTAINGGGIYNNVSDASITSTITNCEISGCKATGSAYNNGYGGGIYNASGALELTDVNITGKNDIDNTDARFGGGIYNSGSLTVTGGKISNCTTVSGGGIYNSAGTLKMTGVTISNCTANSNGGGIVVSGETGDSVITNCKIECCTANNTASGDAGGGGIYCYRQALTLTGGTISDCESACQGGGISIQSGKSPLTIDGVTITNCNANIGGGASIFTVATEGINQEIKNCIIKLCEATSTGGGIHIPGNSIGGKYSFVNVSDTEISECTSPSGSGVFLSVGTSLLLKDSTVKNDVGTSTGVPSIYLAGSTTVTEGVIDFSAYTATYKAKVYVQDALGQNPVATIKLGSAYQIGDIILQAAEGYTLTETDCQRFTIDGGVFDIALVDGNGVLVGIDAIYLDSSSGSDANSGLTASKAVKTLSKAIELFDSQYAQKIMVCETYTLPSEEINVLDRMGGGKRNLLLVRYDGSSDVSGSFTGTLLTISQGNVTITNVTLDGNKEKVTASGHLLYIEGSTTVVTLGGGATVCNNKRSSRGSGVYISEGTFKMTGGAVTGNEGTGGYGPGVYINDYAKFDMSGGKISGNDAHTSTYGGGGVYTRGTFTMSGGEISGNNAGCGGGVYVPASSRGFTITGGKIINNTATLQGGGVYANGSFTMEGGEITGNTATTSGNGVYDTSSNFTHNGGTVQED